MRIARAKRSAAPIGKPKPNIVAKSKPVAKPLPTGYDQPLIKPLALRPPRAALALDCSERNIWSLIKQGRLRVSRVNGITLVLMSSIEELLFASADAPAQVLNTDRGSRRRAAEVSATAQE